MEQLKKEYAGKLSVEFYNVKQDAAIRQQYRVRLIPTQVFLDAEGREFYRHEGYLSVEEIRPVLASIGVTVDG